MPTETARIPTDSSAANDAVSPQFTRWRAKARFEYHVDPESTSVKLVPTSYMLPQLLPAPNSVETSQKSREILIALQSWEGVVLDVDDDSFAARLVDVVGEHEDEEVVLAKDELCDFDLALLEPGAIFYWTIGYRQVRGARERVSRIRLRRLPAWTSSQLAENAMHAEKLARDLDW